MQMKGVNVNDDEGLEREADWRTKIIQSHSITGNMPIQMKTTCGTVQMMKPEEEHQKKDCHFSIV